MRLGFSAFLLSTALAASFVPGASMFLAPPAQAQAAVQAGEVDIDALLALLPPDAKASYASKSYDALSGITTVRDLKIFDPAREAESFVTIQELGLRGVDLAAFRHVFDFAAYGATPDETFKQLIGDISIKNASITVRGEPVGTVEAVAFGGVQMKQLAARPPGHFGAADDEKAAAQFLGALLDSAITGEIKATNLSVLDEVGKVSVKGLVFGGMNRGQFGPSSLDTLEATEDGFVSKVASATSEGADFSKVVPWLLKGELPPIGPDALLYFGASSVNGISYDFEGTTLSIGSYTVEPINFYWLVPASLKVSVSDVLYKPSLTDGSDGAEGLGELGLDHLDLDAAFAWTFDGASGGASLKELRVSEPQLFDAALSFDLTGVNLALLIDPATAPGAAMNIGVTGAQFFLKNNGGFDRLLAAAAKEKNSTPEALRQNALGQFSQLEGGIPQPDGTVKPLSDRVKSIIAAFKAFITSPGTLTIKVQPAAPITSMLAIGAMTDPMAAAETLGVTVESTPQ